ncbi:MAG: helix-turn-helix domain-containing protein [Desulfobulbaceae bacterium]
MNIDEIIERAIELAGVSNEAQLCKKMGITQSALGSRKRRGTAKELIFTWAEKNQYDLNYLFRDEKSEEKVTNQILKEMEEWITENEQKNKDFKYWFKVELDRKFPDFFEWKKRKEERGEDNKLSGLSNVA